MERITRWAKLVTLELELVAASLPESAKAGEGTVAEPLGKYSRQTLSLRSPRVSA